MPMKINFNKSGAGVSLSPRVEVRTIGRRRLDSLVHIRGISVHPQINRYMKNKLFLCVKHNNKNIKISTFLKWIATIDEEIMINHT